jgi:ribosomal protein L11 methyltransferase
MAWLRLTFTSYPPCLQDLGALLEQFDAISISYAPVTGDPVFGDAAVAERYWERTSVSALFDQGIDTDILIACVRNRVGTDNILDCRVELVQDANWIEAHRSGFAPRIYGGRLCICPSWCERPAEIPHIIELDPGLAFGTGAHATTALCLEWLAGNDLAGKRVIDYGCGSGILALAAAALGAAEVQAVDIDPQALLATGNNAANNRLAHKIHTTLPGNGLMQQADLLMANILLNPLLELAPVFKGSLAGNGTLVLSGILATQAHECLKAYTPWFDMHGPVYRDEWAMLCGVRTGAGLDDDDH